MKLKVLEKILKKDAKRYGTYVIIEPFRDNGPKGYLEAVKSVAKKYGAVLLYLTKSLRDLEKH